MAIGLASENLFILNQGLEMRAPTGGKTRYTIRVVSEPLVINTDPDFLAMAPAKRLAAYLKQQVLAIATSAPAATIRARQTALKAFVQGKPWAMKRYSGGRTGSMPPLRSERAFNDSERLANSITATQAGAASKDAGTWRVNVASNRLTDEDSGGFERIWNRLVQLVPAFGDPLAGGVVEEGIRWSLENMIKKEAARSSRLTLDLARGAFDLVKQIAELADMLSA